ncbi:MAG: response regulator [Acidimicrobiia bacterium]|nr:response regulator [Acidimicrobiia bacterium]
MTTVLLATDYDGLFDDVDGALASADTDVLRVKAGADVLPVCQEKSPDLVILDLQIGNMGGIATCIALKQEQGAGRLPEFAVALLLDRAVDVFLAQEASADGWLIKPIDSLRLRRMANALLAGETAFEHPSATP